MFDRLHMMLGEGTAPTPAPPKADTQATPEGVAFAAEYATQVMAQAEANQKHTPITESSHLGQLEFNLPGAQFSQTPGLVNPLGLPSDGSAPDQIDTTRLSPKHAPTESTVFTPLAGSIARADSALSAPASGEVISALPRITPTTELGRTTETNLALPLNTNRLSHWANPAVESSNLPAPNASSRPAQPTTPATEAVLDARVDRLTRPIVDGEVPLAQAHRSTSLGMTETDFGALKQPKSGVKTPAHFSSASAAVSSPQPIMATASASLPATSWDTSRVQTSSEANTLAANAPKAQPALNEDALLANPATGSETPKTMLRGDGPPPQTIPLKPHAETPVTPQTATIESLTPTEAKAFETGESTPNPSADDVRSETRTMPETSKVTPVAAPIERTAFVSPAAAQAEGSLGTLAAQSGAPGQAQIKPTSEHSDLRKPERIREAVPGDVRTSAALDADIKTPQAVTTTSVNTAQIGSVELASSTAPLGLSPVSSTPQSASPLPSGVVLTPSAPMVQPPTLIASPAEVPQIVSQSLAQNEATERITIQLDPPELGRVAIDFQIDENGVHTVTITGENNEAIRKLRLMNFELLQALEQQGMAGRSFSLEYQSSDQALDWAEAETGSPGEEEGEIAQQAASHPSQQPSVLESRTLALAGRGLNLRV